MQHLFQMPSSSGTRGHTVAGQTINLMRNNQKIVTQSEFLIASNSENHMWHAKIFIFNYKFCEIPIFPMYWNNSCVYQINITNNNNTKSEQFYLIREIFPTIKVFFEFIRIFLTLLCIQSFPEY